MSSRQLRFIRIALLPLLVACNDRLAPTAPLPAPRLPDGAVAVECTVGGAGGSMTCVTRSSDGARGVAGDRIIGGQERFVKLAAGATSYDAGTGVRSFDVTVENLASEAIGTSDGQSVSGLKVFFASGPTVTSGAGSVTVANPDGNGVFTSSSAPYFLYAQLLRPFETSAPRTWRFNVPDASTSFTFTVYVSAAMVSETSPLLDKVWSGRGTGDWIDAANWAGGVVPGDTSSVTVFADSVTGVGHVQPHLGADTAVANLRLASGATLDLQAHVLRVTNDVDATGRVINGTLVLTGPTSRIAGTVNAVVITGSVVLDRATSASGTVTVSGGSLTVADHPLTISIP